MENLISGSSSGEQRIQFAVARWQPSLLYFSDEPVECSVTPATTKAIVGFQTSLVESPHATGATTHRVWDEKNSISLAQTIFLRNTTSPEASASRSVCLQEL
jgi:hypothetical protein